MVIPWVGYPLSEFIKRFEPTSKAKYVEFKTLVDMKQMPGQTEPALQWPYVEGLRMDEAMHPLTLLGRRPLRRGAAEPERRADPPGGAVEVRLQGHQVDRARDVRRERAAQHLEAAAVRRSTASTPTSIPQVDHPRWTQGSERRLGEFFRRKTLLFNGYGDQVASLYSGHGPAEVLLIE